MSLSLQDLGRYMCKNARKAKPHNIPCESLHPWVSHRLELSSGISRVHPPHRSSGKMTTFEFIGLGFITWTSRIWIPNLFIDAKIVYWYRYRYCIIMLYKNTTVYGTWYPVPTGSKLNRISSYFSKASMGYHRMVPRIRICPDLDTKSRKQNWESGIYYVPVPVGFKCVLE